LAALLLWSIVSRRLIRGTRPQFTFTPPAIVLIPLKELPVLTVSSCISWWSSRLGPETAESGIAHDCAGTGDRLKRSQQIIWLTRRSQIIAGKH
jgi:hypothetical protein